jgi:tetratricopeptide (TPR) repeat protein/DNA-binding XRE family transcriptional regulator
VHVQNCEENRMDRDMISAFGELLKAFRQRKCMTQQQLAKKLGVHRNTIGCWERGDYLPEGKGMVLELTKHLRLNDLETRHFLEASFVTLAPYWSVPVLRNPFFIGREEILERLHACLGTGQVAALTQSYGLYGLGGIGKTQVAVEYAYRHALEYSAVFWLAVETSDSMMASMQQIANQLQLSERQAMEQPQMVAAVQRWLATHSRWLLIGDNVEDLDLFQTMVPSSAARQGTILLTTRRQALGILAEPLELPPMSNEEGMALVQRRARRLRREELQRDASAASELVQLLEGLPLALDQAGAYIEETGCGVGEYVQRYHKQRKHVLARRGIHGGAHPASVTTTLGLSVEQVEQRHPAAGDLLRLCAFLPPEAIPEELFVTGASHLGPVLEPVVADPYQFDLTLAALRSASLVTRHLETRSLTVHRLVQAVLQDQMKPAEAQLWSERVVYAVNAAFPESEFDVWAQCERYLAQALACVPLIERVGSDLPEAAELLSKIGAYLLGRGRYQEAEPLLVQAQSLAQQRYGTEHPALIPLLLKQAELLWRQGKYEKIPPLLQRTLALGETAFEPMHPQIAEILNSLAVMYREQREYEWAEPLFMRALHIQEVRCGPEHPDTAIVLANLATLYREQHKEEQAEPLYHRALSIQEQHMGSNHPKTALTYTHLATLYRVQGKQGWAELLYQRALHSWEQSESAHPEMAFPLLGLAILYQEQGRPEQAELLYQQALSLQEQLLGSAHPQTERTIKDLADLYRGQRKYEQAEPLYQRVLAFYEQFLGSTHPQTVEIRNEHRCLLELQRKARETSDREQKEHAPLARVGLPHHRKVLHASLERIPAPSLQKGNPLHRFLTDRCELHPQAWSRASELWQAYENWVVEQQERFPLSRRAFTVQLKAHGCRADRTPSSRIWRGIALASPIPDGI